MPNRTKPHASHLRALIDHTLEQRAVRPVLEDHPEGKVTVRLDLTSFYWLTQLADLMDVSRTRAASDLLTAAVQDAVQAAGFERPEPAEMRERLRAFAESEFGLKARTAPPGE
ncbi:hypothetical protein [Deinococcus maricopensis]|nr:hypothetical protein [Deinococcus maricopensis]